MYSTAGTERYIAIAVETAEQWHALRRVAPLDAFADSSYDALEVRQTASEAIDDALRAWTARLPGRELEAQLIASGVPASVVQRMSDLHADPQLVAREFFQPMPHPASGTVVHDGLATHFSAKREILHTSAPCLGEHNEYVLSELLGIDEAAIRDFAAAGALT